MKLAPAIADKVNMKVIAESIDYIVAHYQDQPDLDFLARRAGYEASYYQKLFKDKVGISPKRLQQYLNMRHARELLGGGCTTLEAAHACGLSGNGRLHDLFVSCEGMTPGQVQGRGAGLMITVGLFPSVLGKVVVAKTERGVCWLGFLMEESEAHCMSRIARHWPKAQVIRDDEAVASEAAQLMRIWAGSGDAGEKLKLDLYGTNFQLQVWQALLKIPCGETVTYSDLAQNLGRPKAGRAVGNAVGANPVSLLIPCHRVIRASGIIDNYGWGSPRKKLLLAMEATQSDSARP